MTKKNIKLILFILILIGSFSVLNISKVFASECSDKCESAYPTDENARDKCEDECKDLEKKAKTYENILKVNDKQQGALNNQLEYIDQQQSKNQQTLQETNKQIESLSEKIGTLQKDIIKKEKDIIYQRKVLTSLMQSYYDYDQQGLLGIVLLDNVISSSFNQTDYVQQTGLKVSDVLTEIKSAQEDLEKNKTELEEDYEKNSQFKEKLQEEKNSLQSSEIQKQSLLIQTQGEEKKYENLLARIEQQKLELFNFSSASNLDEVSASVKNYPAPSSEDKASTSWYFSQKDSRWGNQRIGNSKSLMKDYGCAVASVAMVFRKNGSGTDPGKLAKEKIFYYDLIKWPGSWSPGIKLSSSVNHGNISWSKIDSTIKKGDPVIVYIKKTNGRGGHYVVITGKDKKDYIVHDPYFGSNLYLGTSKSLVGKIGSVSGTTVDQMIIYN